MKRIKLKYLRAVLFFFLALLFAGLAVIEALPQKSKGPFVQSTEFTVVSSEKQEDGTYLHTVTGTVRNISSKPQVLGTVILRIADQYDETISIEVEMNTEVAPNTLCEVSGTQVSRSVAKKSVREVTNMSTTGDQKITVPEKGMQWKRASVLVFLALSFVCFVIAIAFLVYRMTHRRHRHSEKKKA